MEGLTRTEESNRRKGIIFSVVFHVLVIILAALYGFTFQNPPPEAAGILVNLGIPDVGQGEENAPAASPAEAEPEPEPEPVKEPEPQPEKTKPTPQKETPTPPKKDVVKTEDPEAAALKKQKEEAKKKADAEAKAKADAEARAKAEAKAKADAEAKRKAEEARKAQELKDKIGGALGGGNGSGKGNTGKPGNQGDPDGGDSDILKGKTTGSGVVEGFGGRGFTKPAAPKDDSQDTGNIAVAVCVDKNGRVISAEYTQKGSTSASSRLKAIAIENAKKYKFDAGGPDKQCGTITYSFRVK
jgi:outer membrane biosynthesis protein TonB